MDLFTTERCYNFFELKKIDRDKIIIDSKAIIGSERTFSIISSTFSCLIIEMSKTIAKHIGNIKTSKNFFIPA
jgi:hypothetical protein